jgi:6-phosphogluconolactonase
MTRRWLSFPLLSVFILPLVVGPRFLNAETKMPASSYLVYVATNPANKRQGIYSYRYDPHSGKLTLVGFAAEQANLGWMATDPQHRFLYAASESDPELRASHKGEGSISSYSINGKTGALTFLNKVDGGGAGSCYLVVDDTGKTLFVANYGSGSVASFAIKHDGSIGERIGFDQHTGSSVNPVRQNGPHAHEVVFSPDRRFIFVPDLGTDQIKIYRVDAAKGTFTPNDPPFVTVKAGLGPRHFTFGRGGKFAYVVCEMGSSVVVFSYNPEKGSLTPVQTISNLPDGFTGIDNSAEIEMDRSGRFLYASNRGHDSITVFAIDPVKGTLTKVQVAPSQGKIPRNFALDPTGNYLIAGDQMSNSLVVFSVDPKDGKLTATGETLEVPSPCDILFVPAE